MEMVLYSRLCPLCFPIALSKRACHPDPRGPLKGEVSHGLALNTVWQLVPLSVLGTGEPAKGWGVGDSVHPQALLSVNTLH